MPHLNFFPPPPHNQERRFFSWEKSSCKKKGSGKEAGQLTFGHSRMRVVQKRRRGRDKFSLDLTKVGTLYLEDF